MITLSDAQIWTVVGVLGATVVGMVTFGFSMMLRTMRAEMGTVRAEMGTVRAEMGTLRSDMQTGFMRIETRLDAMDRDINALMKHTFGIDRE